MARQLVIACGISVLCGSVVLADLPPEPLWTKTFGGGLYEWGRYVEETDDGGTIIVGETLTYGPGHFDVWLIKTDSAGDTLWTRTYGGLGEERCGTVQQTADGGYVIAGTTSSFGEGSYDIWLIKTDGDGRESWNRTYGGGSWDWGYSARQTADGGYVIVGYTESYGPGVSAAWLIKTDDEGAVSWSKTYGGDSYDWGESVRQTDDLGYVIAGNTYSYGAGSRDAWLIKTDSAGTAIWTEAFGGSDSDGGRTVELCNDGGYIFTGYTRSFGAGGDDVWLVKTDADGDTLWTRTFGGNDDDGGEFVLQTVDGGYMIAGHTESFSTGGGDDLWLIRTDGEGEALWTLPLGDDGHDWGRSVQETSDGGFIVVGDTYDYWNGEYDIWLVRLAAPTTPVPPGQNPFERTSIHNYPNPCNPSTTIELVTPGPGHVTLDVFDLRGRRVRQFAGMELPSGRHQFMWDGTDDSGRAVSTGKYLLRAVVNHTTVTGHVILLK